MNLNRSLFIAAIFGFLTLSQEILWVRVLSLSTGAMPNIFAYVLGYYLCGIAFGALIGKKITSQQKHSPFKILSFITTLTTILFYYHLYLTAFLRDSLGLTNIFLTSSLIGVFVICLLNGSIFPVLCHLCSEDNKSVGEKVSYVYVANIIGASIGPLFVGHYLFDKFSFEDNLLIVTIISSIVSITISSMDKSKKTFKSILIINTSFIIFLILPFQLVERNIINKVSGVKNIKYKVENKSSVIQIFQKGDHDVIWGGGMYDGTINIDPVINNNLIDRAYYLFTIKENIEDMLEIGLSIGSWARVFQMSDKVKTLDIVEISEGYTDLIKKYEILSPLLDDPKVKIHIDDGRRWLKKNNMKKYDAIVQNTTWHWRSNITNLLSIEYMKIVKSNLKSNGVFYFNGTNLAEHIAFTASKVFKNVAIFRTFIAASDSDLKIPNDKKIENLNSIKLNNLSYLESSKDLIDKRQQLVNYPLTLFSPDGDHENHQVITDNNMLTEYKIFKHHKLLYSRNWTPSTLFRSGWLYSLFSIKD